MRVTDLDSLRVEVTSTVHEVIARIQNSGSVACALLYENGDFVNIITDGDVRRALLAGVNINDSALQIQRIKSASSRPLCITARVGASRADLKAIFERHTLRQIVLTESGGTPVEVIDQKELGYISEREKKVFSAVIMAGGFGSRLRPFTEGTPKPMLKVNGRPILEINISKLIDIGVRRIFIAIHYLAEQIEEYFSAGEKFGVEIEYLRESKPLGTAGALSLLKHRDETTLVMNGDVLTNLDLEMFFGFHKRSGSVMSVAATQYSFEVPYGVITEKDSLINRIEEKPRYSFLVNSGIYLLSRSVFENLPTIEAYNMTDVIETQLKANMPVACFPVFEHWLDVGRPTDLALAQDLY